MHKYSTSRSQSYFPSTRRKSTLEIMKIPYLSPGMVSKSSMVGCLATNSWKASVSIVAGSIKEAKTIHASQFMPVGLRSQSVFGFRVSQSTPVSLWDKSESSLGWSVFAVSQSLDSE
jgi:hypothetical protein